MFGFSPTRPPEGQLTLVDGHLHLLSAAAAEAARSLTAAFELVWCTGWEDRADDHLPRALGLPAGLAHVGFDDHVTRFGLDPQRHWKLGAIDAFAGEDRALAWVDDGFDASCERWAATRRGPTRLLATDPSVGLTSGQAAGLRRWAAALEPAGDGDRDER